MQITTFNYLYIKHLYPLSGKAPPISKGKRISLGGSAKSLNCSFSKPQFGGRQSPTAGSFRSSSKAID
jgi:hypothetical protein